MAQGELVAADVRSSRSWIQSYLGETLFFFWMRFDKADTPVVGYFGFLLSLFLSHTAESSLCGSSYYGNQQSMKQQDALSDIIYWK